MAKDISSTLSRYLLLTGANGFLGGALSIKLNQLGYHVKCVIRNSPFSVNPHIIKITSIDGQTNWSDHLTNIDVVVHAAARVHIMNDIAPDPMMEFRKVNVVGTVNLAEQAAIAGVKRFIFISSVKVNGEKTEFEKSFSESDAPSPEDSYGITKYEAEQALLSIAKKSGMEVVIIRPPLVYGPGVKANFANMMRWVQRGIPLPLGAINNKRSFVYIENLVSLIIHCIDHPKAANQIFLASDGEDISTTELLRACASALGVKPRLLPFPQGLLVALASAAGKKGVAQRLCGSLQLDISKSKQLLGWTPPYSLQQGLDETAKWFIDAESAKIQA